MPRPLAAFAHGARRRSPARTLGTAWLISVPILVLIYLLRGCT